MKRLLLIIILMMFVQPADAVVFISGTSSSACSTSISDDFSGTLSLWTEHGTSGAWYLVDGTVANSLASVLLYTDEQTCTITQWAMSKLVLTGGVVYAGFYFRSENDETEYAYAVRYEETAGQFVWRYCGGADNSDAAESCTNIATWVRTLNSGDYFGVDVSGTGTDTEIAIYDLGTTAKQHANWASSSDASTTMTDDPGIYAADTGKYIGVYSGSSQTCGWDDFEGG